MSGAAAAVRGAAFMIPKIGARMRFMISKTASSNLKAIINCPPRKPMPKIVLRITDQSCRYRAAIFLRKLGIRAGSLLMDYTDSTNPVEIAYFDRGPIHEKKLVLGGYWSTYWYDGKIYGTEIARGLDVFALEPSEFLSENEIAAAALADQGRTFNPQQQFPVSWPAEPVVAKAYMDQLQRSDGMTAEAAAELTAALDRADTLLKNGESDAELAGKLSALSGNIDHEGLSKTLSEIAAGLQ